MSHRPRKRFGQNFLHDPGTIAKIIAAIAPQLDDHLVEIGPGQGAITAGLLENAGSLDAIELDRDLLAALQQRFGEHGGFRLYNADALKFDLCSLAASTQPLRVCGNLPYNVSTPLLFRFLDQSACIRDMHFMLQKEVVDRMAATAGSKVYGRLSVMLQVRCEVTALFTIGPGAFQPAPKVHSAFVRLEPYEVSPWPVTDRDLLAKIVMQAFSQRRKTLRNALQGTIDPRLFEAEGIDPGARAEQLAPADFVALANAACKSPVLPRH